MLLSSVDQSLSALTHNGWWLQCVSTVTQRPFVGNVTSGSVTCHLCPHSALSPGVQRRVLSQGSAVPVAVSPPLGGLSWPVVDSGVQKHRTCAVLWAQWGREPGSILLGGSLVMCQQNIHPSMCPWIHLRNHRNERGADPSEPPLLQRQDCSLQCHWCVHQAIKSLVQEGLGLFLCKQAALAQPQSFSLDSQITSLSFSSQLMKKIISLCRILIPLSSVCLHPADMFISSL